MYKNLEFDLNLKYLSYLTISNHGLTGHLGRHLGVFFQIFFLRKIAATFTEISRKHVSVASNRNIIKNRV